MNGAYGLAFVDAPHGPMLSQIIPAIRWSEPRWSEPDVSTISRIARCLEAGRDRGIALQNATVVPVVGRVRVTRAARSERFARSWVPANRSEDEAPLAAGSGDR